VLDGEKSKIDNFCSDENIWKKFDEKWGNFYSRKEGLPFRDLRRKWSDLSPKKH